MAARKDRRHEHWWTASWRPAMGWQYVFVCLFDFILAPTFLGFYAVFTKTPIIIWHPMTLEGGGMYHLSMGAIVGVTSYGRTKEKISNDSLPVGPAEAPTAVEPDPEK
jgi:hypothetical protein